VAVINIHEAKTHFSRLLSRVESGEEIVIAKAGKPVARLVPFAKSLEKRKPGSAKGQIVLGKSFYKSLSDSPLEKFNK
jgi:prevent-host-death family protein